ncbi:MAG TPA: C4-type zinc ribbon domain-containing protein [Sumerlaeia bacterium]|nr:C4-type zinc ribbon domain-containing protein [Sumerlaeia bacterium]
MNPKLKALLQVQEADAEIHRIQRELERYPSLRRTREGDVERARKQIEEAREAMKGLERRVRQTEAEVREWREALRRFAAQQASVKTQKEYEALTHEMAETERKISEADEQGLAYVEEEERLSERLADLERNLETRGSACEQESQRLAEREAEKSALLAEFQAKRRQMAEQVDRDLLHQYERLREHHLENYVVPIVDENCGGCHMRILPRRLQEISRPDAIVRCDSCHRFLYVETAE